MDTGCPNLKTLYGARYRVEWADEREPRARNPWYYQIPCKAGVICPWGQDKLAVCLAGRRSRLVRRLVEEAGCQVVQSGDAEVNLAFPLSSFKSVARIVRPLSRKRLSPAVRRRLIEQLSAARELRK